MHRDSRRPGGPGAEPDRAAREPNGRDIRQPIVRLSLKVVVCDKDGRLLSFRHQESHSFVLAFIQHLYIAFNASSLAGVVDTGGTSRTVYTPTAVANSFLTMEAESGTLLGLVVGTGSTAVAITDSALAALIADGAGAGQLSHGAQTVASIGGSGASRSFTVQRIFTNNSGAAIVVAETGAHCQSWDTSAAARTFLLWRDVLGSTVSVPNLSTITVTYTVQITV